MNKFNSVGEAALKHWVLIEDVIENVTTNWFLTHIPLSLDKFFGVQPVDPLTGKYHA